MQQLKREAHDQEVKETTGLREEGESVQKNLKSSANKNSPQNKQEEKDPQKEEATRKNPQKQEKQDQKAERYTAEMKN